MSKELEILEAISKEECLFKDRSTIYMGGEKVNSFTWKHTIGVHFKGIEDIKQALQRLEEIDQANPSEALKELKLVENWIKDRELEISNVIEPSLNTIKQALIKSQEQEKGFKELRENVKRWHDTLKSKNEYASETVVAEIEDYWAIKAGV